MREVMNRLERLLNAHPWMDEEDARSMLVAKYFLLTKVGDKVGPNVNAAMEEFTNELIIMDEEKLRGAINFANRS